jgi:hypothetical protein
MSGTRFKGEVNLAADVLRSFANGFVSALCFCTFLRHS